MRTIQLNTKQILLATLFIIIAGSANAKGTETLFASGLENIAEPELKVENWMVNENHWNVTGKTVQFIKDYDSKLEIESWMTDYSYWTVQQSLVVETATDDELKVENWMISEEYWK